MPLSFFSTVIVETGGDVASIQQVKQLIVYGIALLVPAMAAAGLSGNSLAGKSRAGMIVKKKDRMKRIAIMGLLVLIPSAITLHYLAGAGDFGRLFYSVQAVELIAGATNIFWMGQNMKAGFMLSGRLAREKNLS